MKYSETGANNETQSKTNTPTQCSNLNTNAMHKYQNTKLDWYLPFPRFLLSS